MKARRMLCLVCILVPALAVRAQDDPRYRGQRLSQYVRALRHSDPERRARAAAALGGMRLPEPTALAGLAVALGDDIPWVRREASTALAAIGPAAVPCVAKVLDHTDPAVRAAAVSCLAAVAAKDRAAIGPLIRALRDDVPSVRLPAAEALGRCGPAARAAVPDLVNALHDSAADLRSAAVRALGQIGPSARAAVPALVAVLNDSRRARVIPRALEAAEALGRIGPAARPAAPILAATLGEGDPGLRLRAAWALLAVGADAAPVVPVLASLLDDPKLARAEHGPALQAQAADLLGWIGPEARAAVPALVRRAVGSDYPAGPAALKALVRIGDGALPELIRVFPHTSDPGRKRLAFVLQRLGADAVGPLTHLLGHPRAEVRAAAAQALEDFGRQAGAALPRLEEALDDPAMTVRLRAAEAILALDRRHLPALRFLARTLKDREHRLDALRILTYLTPTVDSAAPAFAELVLDSEDRVSDHAWDALIRLGSPDPLALAVARRELGAAKAGRRQKAIESLAKMGPRALETTDLVRALADSDVDVRKIAVEALGKRGSWSREAVPALVTALRDRDDGVRLQAIKVLGHIGPAAAPAVPALMVEWNRPDTRDDVAEALGRIGPPALPFVWQAFRDRTTPGWAKMAPVLTDIAVNARSSLVSEALDDADPAVRREVLGALKRPSPEFLRCLQPVLMEMALKERDTAVRRDALSLLEPVGRGTAPALGELLHDPVADIRTKAAKALVRSPRHVARAVPVLLQGIRSRSARETGDAEQALYLLGPEAQPAVPILRRALEDPDDDVRLWAALALGCIGPAAREAVPTLRRALRDGDPQVRLAAADSWTLIERRPAEALPIFLAAMQFGDQPGGHRIGYTVRPTASLARYGPAAVRAVVQALLGNKPGPGAVGEDALWFFEHLEAEAKEAVPGLTAALRAYHPERPPFGSGASSEAAEAVIHILGCIGPGAGEAVPLLAEILTGKDPRLQVAAAEALADIGPAAAGAVPALRAALRDRTWMEEADSYGLGFNFPNAKWPGPFRRWVTFPDHRWGFSMQPSYELLFGHDLRSHAAHALGRIGPAARSAVPELREALQARSGPTFRLAEALWYVSGRTDGVVPELVRLLRQLDARGAEFYVLLADVGPKAGEAVPVLAHIVHQCLSRPPGSGTLNPLIPAIEVLGRIGPAARKAIPDLERALQSDEDELRGAAALALWRIDRRADQAVPVLVRLVRGERPPGPTLSAREAVESWVRGAAAEALGEIGAAAKPAAPALRDALQEKDGALRVAAAAALWRIDGDAAAALPVFAAALRDRDETVRRIAAEALGRLGPRARAAVPALQDLLDDEDVSVRRAAAAALRQIRQER